jgi:hypothetical protein
MGSSEALHTPIANWTAFTSLSAVRRNRATALNILNF